MKTCVMIHHSAGPDGAALNFVGIREFHVQERHWRDIGYHLVIEKVHEDGQPVALLGRPLHWTGAHAGSREWNAKAIGVCFVGNYMEAPPPIDWLQEGARQIAGICRELQLNPAEDGVIVAHQDVKATDCPGRQFPMETLRDLIVDAI